MLKDMEARQRTIMDPDCKKAEYLVGPVELDILDHAQSGTRIVFLGDIHVNMKKCPSKARCTVPIWSYLQNLFEQYEGKEPLDFFLEIEFAEEMRNISPVLKRHESVKQDIAEGNVFNNYLQSLRIHFYECFQEIKNMCKFYSKPIRFHYSDIRSGVIHSETETKERIDIRQIRGIYKHGGIGSKENLTQNDINFLKKLIDKAHDGNIDYFFHLTKIDKQLREIEQVNSSIAQGLREYMGQHLKIFVQRDVSDFYERLELIWLFLLAPLFDVYTLARIFRHNMTQVIVYAGSMHTNAMKKFLMQYFGFKHTVSVQSKTKNKHFQCIPLKNVPQPWFPVQ